MPIPTTVVIDIDSHFEPGEEWLNQYPELAARLPKLDPAELAIDAYVGDLLRDVPKDQWPPREDLLPPGLLQLFGNEKQDEATRRAEFEGKTMYEVANAQARVKWMDEHGIDIQNVICLAAYGYHLFLSDVATQRELLHVCNSWLAQTCDPSNGRLLPVTMPDYSDLDVAIAELERMRKHASRIFLIPGRPVNGVPVVHPSWDRLWAAAVSLGMTPMFHGGLGRMRFEPGWGNLGGDTTLLRRFGSAHHAMPPMTMIYAFVYSGVFERFPTLTLLIAEFGTGWLPYMLREIDDRASPISELFIGKWNYPLRPSEYLARNVRATPLGTGGCDLPIVKTIQELPDDMLVFSTDFPHFEGFAHPLRYYDEALKEFSLARRKSFLGGSMANVYARMGDPIAR